MPAQRIRFCLVLLAALTLAWSAAIGGVTSAEERTGRAHAEWLRLRCGPRAAWAFSLCCDAPLDHDATMASFEQREDTVTLRGIAAFLEAQGLRCELRRLSPTELTPATCPSIVHLAPTDERDGVGHFVLVTAAGESGVMVVEPQVGSKEQWSWSFFCNRWTGHCLFAAPRYFSERRLLGLCLCFNLMVILCFFVFRSPDNDRGQRAS